MCEVTEVMLTAPAASNLPSVNYWVNSICLGFTNRLYVLIEYVSLWIAMQTCYSFVKINVCTRTKPRIKNLLNTTVHMLYCLDWKHFYSWTQRAVTCWVSVAEFLCLCLCLCACDINNKWWCLYDDVVMCILTTELMA